MSQCILCAELLERLIRNRTGRGDQFVTTTSQTRRGRRAGLLHGSGAGAANGAETLDQSRMRSTTCFLYDGIGLILVNRQPGERGDLVVNAPIDSTLDQRVRDYRGQKPAMRWMK